MVRGTIDMKQTRYRSWPRSRRQRALCALALGAGMLLAGAARQASAAEEVGGRAWSTADSIAIRGFGPIVGSPAQNVSLPVAVSSPDGRYFHVLSSHGDLACSCTLAELLVFDTQAVRRWLASDATAQPAPLRTVPMRTRGPRGEALQNVVWNTDTSLIFLGRDEADTEQYYRLEVPSGALRALTKEPASSRRLAQYTSYVQGQTVLFRQLLRHLPVNGGESAADGAPRIVAAPRDAAGRIKVVRTEGVLEWRAVHGDGETWTLPVGGISELRAWFASSDGRWAVLVPDIEGLATSYTPDRFVLVDF